MAEDEWEWEYDESQTETLYFTVDLTTHVAPSLKKGAAQKKKPSKDAKKTVDIATEDGEVDDDASEAREDTVQRSESPPAEHGNLQIVDLASRNPLLSFDNQFYSCHWGTDIGTTMYLTGPSQSTQQEHQPLRAYQTFNLAATTSARLLGVPAILKPRLAPLDSGSLHRHRAAPDDVISETTEGDTVRYSATQGLRIDTTSTAAPEKVGQARFLERFSAARLKRGEKEPVPVKFMKEYTLPKNWQAERDAWVAKETANNEQAKHEAAIRGEIMNARSKQQRNAQKQRRQRRNLGEVSEIGIEDDQGDTPDEGFPDDDQDEDEQDPEEDGMDDDLDKAADERTSQPETPNAAKTPIRKRVRVDDTADLEPQAKRRPPGRPRKIRLTNEIMDTEEVVAESSAAAAARDDDVVADSSAIAAFRDHEPTNEGRTASGAEIAISDTTTAPTDESAP